MSTGATSPSRAPVSTVAYLSLGGALDVVDVRAPHRRERIAVAPVPLTSRSVRRRWATYALETAGWWAHGRWWSEGNDSVRRVIPAERVAPGGI